MIITQFFHKNLHKMGDMCAFIPPFRFMQNSFFIHSEMILLFLNRTDPRLHHPQNCTIHKFHEQVQIMYCAQNVMQYSIFVVCTRFLDKYIIIKLKYE